MTPWAFYYPARIVLTPLIWWDHYLRRRKLKPDEWYWADKWLTQRGHHVNLAPWWLR